MRLEFNCSKRAYGYFTKLVTSFHQPHAEVLTLHVRLENIVSITLKTVGSVGVWTVARTGWGKPCVLPDPSGRHLLAPCMEMKKGARGSLLSEQGQHQLGSHPMLFILK